MVRKAALDRTVALPSLAVAVSEQHSTLRPGAKDRATLRPGAKDRTKLLFPAIAAV